MSEKSSYEIYVSVTDDRSAFTGTSEVVSHGMQYYRFIVDFSSDWLVDGLKKYVVFPDLGYSAPFSDVSTTDIGVTAEAYIPASAIESAGSVRFGMVGLVRDSDESVSFRITTTPLSLTVLEGVVETDALPPTSEEESWSEYIASVAEVYITEALNAVFESMDVLTNATFSAKMDEQLQALSAIADAIAEV